ncbi:transporter substrate-binding domain-containing protein [Pseudomonas lini]
MGWAAPAPPAHVVHLSPAQQQWLAQHGELRVGVVLQTPYAQYDRRLQRLSGVNIELMKWLAKALKIELSWRNYPDLAQLEAAAREGDIDIAPGLTQTPAALRLWQFFRPLHAGAATGGQRPEKHRCGRAGKKLDSQTRVAVRMPSVTADYLRSNYPHLNLQGVPLERQALQLLLSQQAGYAVVDEAQFGRLSVEPEFSGLAVVGDIGFPQLLRVATRRDWPELAGIVESALRAIPAKDLEQLHNQWLQPKYPRLSESPGFWQKPQPALGDVIAEQHGHCVLATSSATQPGATLAGGARRHCPARGQRRGLAPHAVFHRSEHCRHPLGQLGQPCALRQPGGRNHARLPGGRDH